MGPIYPEERFLEEFLGFRGFYQLLRLLPNWSFAELAVISRRKPKRDKNNLQEKFFLEEFDN